MTANIMFQKLSIVIVLFTLASRATGVRSALHMLPQVRHAFLVLRTKGWILVLVLILVPPSPELNLARPTRLACPFHPDNLTREEIDSWRIVDINIVTQSDERPWRYEESALSEVGKEVHRSRCPCVSI